MTDDEFARLVADVLLTADRFVKIEAGQLHVSGYNPLGRSSRR
jgi:hypothetical protein